MKENFSHLFSCSVVSDSLWPHGLQHARLPYLSLSPGVCTNLCPLSWWCHPTISSSVIPFSSCPQSFPPAESFPMSGIRWPKYWNFSFSISPSNEYSGLISFKIDLFDLLVVQGNRKSLLQNNIKSTENINAAKKKWFLSFWDCKIDKYIGCQMKGKKPKITMPEMRAVTSLDSADFQRINRILWMNLLQ